MALAGALRHLVHVVAGFTNASRWPDSDYRSTQMSYDLRLRLHGLIERLAKTNTYVLTPEGLRVAVFYTKLHSGLLGPLLEADQPPHPSNCGAPCERSNTSSRTTSVQRVSGLPPETCHKDQRLEDQEDLGNLRCSFTRENAFDHH
jgi:hypothetical protein